MQVKFHRIKSKNKNLYCTLREGGNAIRFSLGTRIEEEDWNNINNEPSDHYRYNTLLSSLKWHLEKRSEQIDTLEGVEKLRLLKNEISALIDSKGLEGLQRWFYNKDRDVPDTYDNFIIALETFTNQKKESLRISVYSDEVYVHDRNDLWIRVLTRSTLENLLIKSISDGDMHEFYNHYCEYSWIDVLKGEDMDIKLEHRLNFIDSYTKNWEQYWQLKKEEFSSQDRYLLWKQRSWNSLKELIDEMITNELHKCKFEYKDEAFGFLLVITMLDYFNTQCCLEEYICYYLEMSKEWEEIDLTQWDEDEIDIVVYRESYYFQLMSGILEN